MRNFLKGIMEAKECIETSYKISNKNLYHYNSIIYYNYAIWV